MSDDGSSFPSIPWAPLIALIMAGSGILLLLPQINSSRPTTPGIRHLETAMGEEDVDSRLWQDPIAAVYDAIHNLADQDPAMRRLDGLRDRIREIELDKQSLKLLPVYVPGGSYAEEVERRLRDRVAVVEGLEASGYDPEQHEQIGFFRLPFPKREAIARPNRGFDQYWERAIPSSPNKESPRPSLILPLDEENNSGGKEAEPADVTAGASEQSYYVPYEWWDKTSETQRASVEKAPERILVMWVPVESAFDAPLARLGDLVSWFQWKAPGAASGFRGPPVIAIGPENSDSFKSMVRETSEPVDLLTKQRLQSTQIYSAQPEAADSVLPRLGGHSSKRLIQRSFQLKDKQGLRFERTIATDDVLSAAMCEELADRHVKPGDSVAIICDQDTFVAHAARQSFINAFGGAAVSGSGDNIHSYAYLRGIDGKLPSDQSGSKSADAAESDSGGGDSQKSGNNAAQSSKTNTTSLRPEGLDQSDYLQRLAGEIVDLYKYPTPRDKPLKAVGILGSDVYDKIEILEILRPRLPGVIFFTNQLDARFALPEEWNVTRNLLVFSGYGLELGGRKQCSEPPFRDSEQTSLFATLLEALDGMRSVQTKGAHVFEIGRRGAIELPSETVDKPVAPGTTPEPRGHHGIQHPKMLEKMPPASINYPLLWGAAALGGLLYFLVWMVTGRHVWLPDEERKERHFHALRPRKLPKYMAPVFGILLVEFLWCFWDRHGILRNQLFLFSEGITLWPTLAIWHLAIILSCCFIAKAQRDLDKNRQEICEKFRLKSQFDLDRNPTPSETPRSWWDTYTWAANSCLVKIPAPINWKHFPEPVNDGVERVDMQCLWNEYERRGTFWQRVMRIAPMLFIFLAVTRIGFLALGIQSPFLGARLADPQGWETILHFALNCFSLIVPPFLTFLVIDATTLHVEFVRRCRQAPTEWPKETYREYDYFRRYIGEENLARYLDIRLIARRTDAINKLIYYPFIYVFLGIICVAGYFYNFGQLMGFYAFSAIYILMALYCSIHLPSLAREYRARVVAMLTRSLSTAHVEGDTKKETVLQQVLDRIQGLDEGAFVAIWEQPVIRAILLPSGGIGIWTLLQYLPH